MDFVQILADTSNCGGLGPIINLIKGIFNIIKIIVPIILIVMGAIDLTKAATSKLIKRTIAAVAVFFIVTLVDVVMQLVSNSAEDTDGNLLSCWNNS